MDISPVAFLPENLGFVAEIMKNKKERKKEKEKTQRNQSNTTSKQTITLNVNRS